MAALGESCPPGAGLAPSHCALTVAGGRDHHLWGVYFNMNLGGGTRSDVAQPKCPSPVRFSSPLRGRLSGAQVLLGARSPPFPLCLRHLQFNDTFPVSRPQWPASSRRQGHSLLISADPAPVHRACRVAGTQLFQLQLLIITSTSTLFAHCLSSARFFAEGANEPSC